MNRDPLTTPVSKRHAGITHRIGSSPEPPSQAGSLTPTREREAGVEPLHPHSCPRPRRQTRRGHGRTRPVAEAGVGTGDGWSRQVLWGRDRHGHHRPPRPTPQPTVLTDVFLQTGRPRPACKSCSVLLPFTIGAGGSAMGSQDRTQQRGPDRDAIRQLIAGREQVTA